jgi:RNA polymerase sigma-70 factor (ECF subfamily)
MDERAWLTERFEEHRTRLQAAYRMLGSVSEADDAVQDAWRASVAPTPAASRTSLGGRPRWWHGCV